MSKGRQERPWKFEINCSAQQDLQVTKLDSENKTGLRYVLDLENTLNEDAVQQVQEAAAPRMAPSRTHFTLGGVVKEICWVLCCCKLL